MHTHTHTYLSQTANPARSFDLLRLHLDSFSINKDTFTLIWLRTPPLSDLCRKLLYLLLIHTL